MANSLATSTSTTSISATLRTWLYSFSVISFIATALLGRSTSTFDHQDEGELDPLDNYDRPLEDILLERQAWKSDWHSSDDGTFETKAAVYRYADAGFIGGCFISRGGGEPFFDFNSEDGPIFDLGAAITVARDLETSYHCSVVSESKRAA